MSPHPSTPPKRPASKTTLSRGEAWPIRRIGCGRAPVVQSPERIQRGEIDFVRELQEPLQCWSRVKDVFQVSTRATSSRPRVTPQHLLLLSRRAQEDARLVHPRSYL